MATLRNKLIFSYSILALLIVAVISLVLNVFLDKVFTEYAISKQQRQMQQLVSRVNQNFRNSIPSYRQELFEVIGKTALENGMILHVSTSSGEIDWDVRRHYRDQCQIVLDHAKFNMHSINPNLEGRYQEQNFLMANNWGTITIGFYGPHNFTDEDVNLITTINRMLINITIGSLLLAVVIGFFMARVFSLPLGQVLAATQKIAKGEFGTRIATQSRTKEIHDLVSSVNEMAERLDKMEKMKRRLTSDVAHELRTPLTNLKSQTEAMIDGILEPDQNRLSAFYAELERLDTLINDMQKLTDVEDDSLKLTREHFDIELFLDNIIRSFQLELQKKRLAVTVDCPPELQVNADKVRLHQIFLNILSNAVKYSPEDSCISISAVPDKEQVVFTVTDTGCGISEEDLPFIFERFYRADKSRTRNTGGSGIGLAISKALVEAHGGRISAVSAPEKGTAFTFSI